MAQPLEEKGLVAFQEMLMANSKMVDALAQLLIDKGVITEAEFYAKLRTWTANTRQGSGQAHHHQGGQTEADELNSDVIIAYHITTGRLTYVYKGIIAEDSEGPGECSGRNSKAI